MTVPSAGNIAASVAAVALALWRRPWVGAVLVYTAAIWFRLSLPWLPLADPDTWGYLNPALQDLAGNGFVQTQTRDLAYPLFLRTCLRITGDFGSVAVVQHFMGLLSGVVWMLAFGLYLTWLPLSVAGRTAAWWIAALCLGAYLCNPATLAFETQIRPEAVFPVFALGQIAAVLEMCRARWRTGKLGSVCLAAFVSALLSVICLSLKPSWGFAAGVPFLVAVIVALARAPLPMPSRASILLSSAVALVLWIAIVPSWVRWIPETASGSFLAGTLFTVHADIIARDMHRRAAEENLDAAEMKFLRKLDTRLAESRSQPKQTYPLLGHDADYLFYRSDLLFGLPGVPPGEDKQAWSKYLRTAYLRAAFADPAAIAGKVWRQLTTVFSDATESVFKPSVQWRKLFVRTNKSLDEAPFPPSQALHIRESLERVRECTAEQPSKLTVCLAPPRWILQGPVSWILAAVVVLGGLAILSSPFWQNAYPRLVPGIFAFAVVWSSAFGAVFTVALIHSFDIDRYGMLLSSCHTLLIACGIVLFGAFVRSLRTSADDPKEIEPQVN